MKATPPPPETAPDHLQHRPQIYRMSDPEQAATVERLRRDPRTMVTDTIFAQLCDLMKVRSPGEALTAEQHAERASAHLGAVAPDAYGTWVHYPWSRRLVHLLDEQEFIEVRTDRNHYKITVAEQRSLATRAIGVVGLSAGNAIAMTIALERSCGELRLADFDALDLSNLNRLRCGVHEIGISKAHLTSRSISEIDPYLRVRCFPDGYTEAMAEEFFRNLDLVVEECDSVDAKIGVRLAARARRIPVLMSTSDSGSTDVERFDLEPQRPLFHGWVEEVEPSALHGLSRDEQVSYIVKMAQVPHISARLKASLVEIDRTVGTWPQLGSDVTMGGAVIADLSRRVLLGQPVPSGRSFVESRPLRQADEVGVELCSVATPDEEGERLAAMLSPAVRSMLEAAASAPSAGNNQPWRFTVAGDVVDVTLRTGLAYTLHDHQSRAAVVAVGAAIENAVLAAHAAGHRIAVIDSTEGWGAVRASLILDPPSGGDEPRDHDHLAASISRRATSRVRAPRVALAPGVTYQLQAVAGSVTGCRLTFVEQPEEIALLATLLGRTERVRMLSPGLHREVVGEFRFTPEEAAANGDGITIPELEFDPKFVPMIEVIRDRPTMDLLRAWDLGQALGEPTRLVSTDAAAFALVTMPAGEAVDYLAGGRATQRVWLSATELGIAVQPVSSLNFLTLRAREAPGSLEPDIEAELLAVDRAFHQLVEKPVGSTEIILLRLAHSGRPSVRSRRWPLHSCTSIVS